MIGFHCSRSSIVFGKFGTKIPLHWEITALSALSLAGFLLKLVPLLQHPHVGADPFTHYKYSMALLAGKLSIPLQPSNAGLTVDLYYPPLFHLISLGFFLAFPNVDPYTIMKIIASAFDALQVIPVYLIVKRVSGSGAGALLASYALTATRSDYEMLAWGGYANIAGLFFLACLFYAVIADSLGLSAVFGAALGLTHHLSTVFGIAVLIPYFSVKLWTSKSIPRSLIGVGIGGLIAFVIFYREGLASIYYYYTTFSPVYNQSLYVTPYILEQVGPLLLLSAPILFAAGYTRAGRGFVKSKELFLIWAFVSLLLSYAYLLGVQWHGVRWIAFIPEPLALLTGMSFGIMDKKMKMIFVTLAALFTFQLLVSIQDYRFDILRNLVQ